METKELKQITKYDKETVNEFIKNLKDVRSAVEKAKADIDERAKQISENAENLEKEFSEEELVENEKALSILKDELEQVNDEIKKWEDEKSRIKAELNKKLEENQKKIDENQQKIEELEAKIKENKEKIADLDKNSDEYKELAKENKSLRGSILALKNKNKKLNIEKEDINKILENLENEIVEISEEKKIEGDEKPTVDNKINWHKKLTQEQIEELIAEGLKPGDNEYDMYLWNHGINPSETEKTDNEKNKAILQLEDEIRKSAARMKEYRETGNYNQEASEHQYYNSLILRLNELKNKEEIKPEQPKKKEPQKRTRKPKKPEEPPKGPEEPPRRTTSAGPTPAGPTPVKPTPAGPTPVKPAPAGPTPVRPTPVGPTLVKPQPITIKETARYVSEPENEISEIELNPFKDGVEAIYNGDSREVIEGLNYKEESINSMINLLSVIFSKYDIKDIKNKLDPNIVNLIVKICGSKSSDKQLEQYINALTGKKSNLSIVYNIKDIYKSNLTFAQIKQIIKLSKQAEKDSKGAIKVEKDNIFKRFFGNIGKRISSRKLLKSSNETPPTPIERESSGEDFKAGLRRDARAEERESVPVVAIGEGERETRRTDGEEIAE